MTDSNDQERRRISTIMGNSSVINSDTKCHRGFEEITPLCQNTSPSLSASDLPYPRSGHRLLASDRYAISVGGFNPSLLNAHNTGDTYYPILKEIWLFNFATLQWKRLTTTGPMPTELASHAALLHDNYVVVCGGTGVPFGHSSTNQFRVLDLKTRTWHLQPATAAAGSPTSMPPEQYGHAFVQHENKFYVIGGTSGFQYNMLVFELTVQQEGLSEWRSLLRGPEALPRYRHEAFYFDGKLHVIGGGTAVTVRSLTHVDIFDLSSGLWSEKEIQADPLNGHPAPRRCHGLAVSEEVSGPGNGLSAYISGGYDGSKAYDDVWQLKVSRLNGTIVYSWHKFPHNLPAPLYFHGMAITPGGSLLVFGGVDGRTETRTASLYRCLLSPPSLLELALREVLSKLDHPTDEKKLLATAQSLNLPESCIDWLKNRW